MLYRKLIILRYSLFLLFLFYFISSKLHEIIYVSLILLDIQYYSPNVQGTDCTNLICISFFLSSSRMHHSSIYPSSSCFNCECTREKMCMFWYSIFEPNRILIYLSNNLFSFNFKDIRVCCKHVGILFEGFL